MKRILLLFCMTLLACLASAQTKLSGRVTSPGGEGLADVSVVLSPKGTEDVIGFTFTDNDGGFALETATGTDSLTLKVFGMNVEQVNRDIANRSQTVDFTVAEKVTELREVVVNEQKMWGGNDTINYAVSAFASEKDAVIGDVLKKMPGIDVKESGEITYQGKGINKFYIENLDLLQGRYGIATNNIAAKDVATVQVLENHQPVQALKDVQFSDRAAINLKLKPEAKNTFSMNTKLSIGAEMDKRYLTVLRDAELAGMFFGRSYQNMTTLKSNNAGHDLMRELTLFNATSMPSPESYISLRMPSPPSIDKARWLRNNSHAATANNLFKLGSSAQLNVNVIGYTDREDRESMAETQYLLPGTGTRVITEQMTSLQRTDLVEGEVRYNRNEQMCYVNNYLRVEGQRKHSEGVILTPNRMEQTLSQSGISLGDVFHYIHRGEGGRGFESQTTLGYTSLPCVLTIMEEEEDGWAASPAGQCQQMQTSTLSLNSTLALLSALTIGNVRLVPRLSAYYQRQELESELMIETDGRTVGKTCVQRLAPIADMRIEELPSVPTDAGRMNNCLYQHFRGMLSADLSYQTGRMKASLSLPLSYNWQDYHDRLREDTDKNLTRVWLQPTASLQYEPATGWAINVGVVQSYRTCSPSMLYGGYILSDYRTLTRYDSRMACSSTQSASVNTSHKDIFRMFFAGAGVSYSRSRSEMLYGQSFLDNSSLMANTTMMEMPNTSQRVGLTGDISKGFDWKKLMMKSGIEYAVGTSQFLQQDVVANVVTDGLSATGALSAQLTSHLLFEWKGAFGTNRSRTRGGETLLPIHSSTNRFVLTIPLTTGFDMTLTHELYHSSATVGDDKFFSLTDAALGYKCKRATWTLAYGNIFNTGNYITAYRDAINTYYSSYLIRPANVLLSVAFKLK